MSKNWIAVACAAHVRLGKHIGIMQVCHGKRTPLKRINPNDIVIYYSPTVSFHGKDILRSFTAIGRVNPGEPYQVEMNPDFHPFRRDVQWAKALEISIAPLLPYLDFTRNNKNWGYQLRYGLVPITEHDKSIIAAAMQAQWL